jgi:hypothetical protein
MRKQKLIIIIAVSLTLLATATISNAAFEKKQFSKNIIPKIMDNQEVYLGNANIDGDGTEENSNAEASAEADLTIKINSETSIIDFYIDYSISCKGITDSGHISLLLQINGEQVGHDETILVVADEEGTLRIEDIEVHRQDVFSYEIIAIYTNGLPPFTKQDTGIGGGAVFMKSYTVKQPLTLSESYPKIIQKIMLKPTYSIIPIETIKVIPIISPTIKINNKPETYVAPVLIKQQILQSLQKLS